MRVFIACITLLFSVELLALRVLHLTFHEGCAAEFAGVARELGFELTTWNFWKMPDIVHPKDRPPRLHCMSHERAERVWNQYKDFFESFDVVVTSDTAPLSRIFLQNNFSRRLVIWVCNRFDYVDRAGMDHPFPDREYYQLINRAYRRSQVAVASNAAFERFYASTKGVDLGPLIIRPYGAVADIFVDQERFVSDVFYVPNYSNNTEMLDLVGKVLPAQGISAQTGRFGTLADLRKYRGIITIPYTYSSIMFFEILRLNIPLFIPSKSFFIRLRQDNRDTLWHQNGEFLFDENRWELSEWYCQEHAQFIVYFDSWEDLKYKIDTVDFDDIRLRMKEFSDQQKKIMLERWAAALGI